MLMHFLVLPVTWEWNEQNFSMVATNFLDSSDSFQRFREDMLISRFQPCSCLRSQSFTTVDNSNYWLAHWSHNWVHRISHLCLPHVQNQRGDWPPSYSLSRSCLFSHRFLHVLFSLYAQFEKPAKYIGIPPFLGRRSIRRELSCSLGFFSDIRRSGDIPTVQFWELALFPFCVTLFQSVCPQRIWSGIPI